MKVEEFIRVHCRRHLYGTVKSKLRNDYIVSSLSGFSYWYYNTCIATSDTEAGILKFNALRYSRSTTRRHRIVAAQYQVLEELNEAIKQGKDSLEVRM